MKKKKLNILVTSCGNVLRNSGSQYDYISILNTKSMMSHCNRKTIVQAKVDLLKGKTNVDKKTNNFEVRFIG